MSNSNGAPTVWHAFYDVLRSYGMTTMFGNPGSTEQPMLKNFPNDFKYILGLQEASVVGMAGGFSEATRKPVVVSLHTSAGTGNAMGTIVTAFLNKIPLVIIAGQQTRDMLLGEPLLANREPETLPRPYVKWSYQPVRAVDVPAAVTRGISIAMQPPAGPVFISVPYDDWDAPMTVPVLPRSVSTRFGPDPERLSMFAKRMINCKKLSLVLGPEVDKALAWDDAVTLAEMFECPVFQAPMSERAVFPETHELFRGPLPSAQGPLGDRLKPFDLVLVLGAEVFRYYPWISGPVVPDGTQLLHITEDPNDSAKALVGDSLLSDVGLALKGLIDICKEAGIKPKSSHHGVPSHVKDVLDSHGPGEDSTNLMTPSQAFEAIAELRPSNAILVHETPSNQADLLRAWPSIQPQSSFTFASGALGWNGPAAVGVALAQQMQGTGRPTILAIGDGSFQYSLQSIYTAVRHKVKLIYLVPVNEEYAVLKGFAELEKTPNVPALDIPGLDLSATAKAFGCPAKRANTKEELQVAFREALDVEGPFLIEFPVDRTLRSLMPSSS